MRHIGGRERGQTFSEPFSTHAADGSLVGIGGSPAWKIRKISGTPADVAASPGLVVSLDDETVTGRHIMTLDTTDAAYVINEQYALIITSGTIGGIDVSNQLVLSWNLQNDSAGRMLQRAVKVLDGTVTSATDNRTFVLASPSGMSVIDDFYVGMELSFQPGAANEGLGQPILKYDGTFTVGEVTVQGDFPAQPQPGDEWWIIPAEKPLTVYTANITVEYGLSTSEADRYLVQWFANGQPLSNPSGVIPAGTNLQVWLYENDIEVINDTMTLGNNSGVYKYTDSAAPTGRIGASEGSIMQANAVIDGIPYAFSRTLFNFA